jgi:predicted SAM-dependent methyltransferase
METNMKIDIGGGEHTQPGFKNVDKYHKYADYIADVLDLPFENNSIEEAYSKHTFEHLSKKEVKLALKEVCRVLIPKSKFTLIVPDAEWCMKEWLKSNDKLGRSMDWLFGGQGFKGDLHKIAYTMDLLISLLEEAGFKIINKSTYIDFDFQALKIEAIKP